MPCHFTGPKMSCASPNFLCRTKNLFTYCSSHNILCQTKSLFAFSKIVFYSGTKCIKFLDWLKTFEQAQNILEPIKGQGINGNHLLVWHKMYIIFWSRP